MGVKIVNGHMVFDSQEVTTSAGENNDVAIYSSSIRVNTANDNDSITGCVSGIQEAGEILWIINTHASNNLVLKHDDTSSTDGNRILLPTGTTMTLAPYEHALLRYVEVSGRAGWWVFKGGTIA